MMLFKISAQLISVTSQIILARLLVKEDFGIVAMAMVVVALLDLMRAFGFDLALIQNQDAVSEHYNTAWTFNIIAASVIALMLILLTPLSADFYNDPRLSEIMPLLAVGVFISGFENVGVVAFRKDLTFHKEFMYMLAKKVFAFVAVVGFALYYRNYWALIYGFIITKIGVVILSYFIHSYKPWFSLSRFKELFGFSAWLFINNLLTFINFKVPEIILGKLLGAGALGIFSVSKDITYSTSSALVIPINRATFPGYSKLNNNIPALRESLLNTQSLIALLIIPASAGFSAIAPVMVPVLLGPKWLESIAIMQILAYAGLIFSLANLTSIYLALGKPRINTMILIIRVIIFIPLLLYASIKYGLNGAAWSILITGVILLPITYAPVIKFIDIGIKDLLSRILRPIFATVVMLLSVNYTYLEFIENKSHTYNIIELFLLVLTGTIVYIASMLALWSFSGYPAGSEQHILRVIKNKLG